MTSRGSGAARRGRRPETAKEVVLSCPAGSGPADRRGYMIVQELSVEVLVEAPWNANRVRPAVLVKVRRSVEQFGIVENLVARPHPELPGRFEVISGNHRLRLY